MRLGIVRKDGCGDNLLTEVKKTETVLERMRGLLVCGKLSEQQGMIMSPCNSVHTFFMSYNIDIIYLDKDGYVLKVVSSLRPWRLSGCLQAVSVLEVLPGVIERSLIEKGDRLIWKAK